MIGKILRFKVVRLLENAFVKLPCRYHDLIINPPYVEQSPYKFVQNKICHPSVMKSFPSYFTGWDTMLLLHWKIVWGCIPQYLQESAK